MTLDTIRAARPDDADELSRVARAAKAHWGYPPEYLALWADDLTVTPQFVRDNAVFCAERDGAPVGFYAIESADDGWEIGHLWVGPAHIGKGIGTRLLRHAADWAHARGIETLRIVSDPHAANPRLVPVRELIAARLHRLDPGEFDILRQVLAAQDVL